MSAEQEAEIEYLRREVADALEKAEELIVWLAEALVEGAPHSEFTEAHRDASVADWVHKRGALAAAERQLDA